MKARRPKRTRGDKLRVPVEQLAHGEGLPLPAYQTEGAAGCDLLAAVPAKKPLRMKSGSSALVPTGLRLAVPQGYEAQVRPRSGLAFRHGVTVLNAPGTIDADYRGELQVLLINHGAKPFQIVRGDRIAQLVLQRVEQAELIVGKELASTVRGAGGFGSTGGAAGDGAKARKRPVRTAKATAKVTAARKRKK